MREQDRPTAIFAFNDLGAINVYRAARQHGISLPEQLSIIGFDDSAYADTVNLTTMRQDPFAMGRAAARKAVKLIAGETLENPYEVVRAQLVLRGTDSVYGGDR